MRYINFESKIDTIRVNMEKQISKILSANPSPDLEQEELFIEQGRIVRMEPGDIVLLHMEDNTKMNLSNCITEDMLAVYELLYYLND